MKILSITLLVASLNITPAFAQSAEETVAFLLYGAEDGREFHSYESLVTFEQTGRSPAEFRVTRSPRSPGLETITVRRLDKCVFQTTITGDVTKPNSTETLDFAQFTNFSRFNDFSILNFKGKCAVLVNGECERQHMVPPGLQGGDDRSDAAIAYLKREFCSGSAF